MWQKFRVNRKMLDTVIEMIELRYNNSTFMQNFDRASIAAFSHSVDSVPTIETLIKANLELVRKNFSKGSFGGLTDLLLRLTPGVL